MSEEPRNIAERRYSRETLQKVVELAARLQEEGQEELSVGEIEAIAAEVGLEPVFVRQALAQITAEQPVVQKQTPQRAFWLMVNTLAFPLVWGTLAFLFRSIPSLSAFFTLVAPFPLAMLLGFFSGHKKVSFWAAALLLWVLIPARVEVLPLALFGWPLAGCLAKWGASLRQEYFPIPVPGSFQEQEISRPDLLKLLFALQSRLAAQKQHQAFLSVDVVNSSEMKRSACELAVEHSFHQFRSWLERIIQKHGGEVHSAAGDGVMSMFPKDEAALRAAQELQQELPQFNGTQNRLPLPFRLRCGVSAGEVAIPPGLPLGHLQSPVIDRAAALQKQAQPGTILIGEEVAAALPEAGSLSHLAEPVDGETAFSYPAEASPRISATD